MNSLQEDLFCHKYDFSTILEYDTPEYDLMPEQFESLNSATKEYSVERLKEYYCRSDQRQRFISPKRHLEYVSTIPHVLCDGKRIVYIDKYLQDRLYLPPNPEKYGHQTLKKILTLFEDMSFNILDETCEDLIEMF